MISDYSSFGGGTTGTSTSYTGGTISGNSSSYVNGLSSGNNTSYLSTGTASHGSAYNSFTRSRRNSDGEGSALNKLAKNYEERQRSGPYLHQAVGMSSYLQN